MASSDISQTARDEHRRMFNDEVYPLGVTDPEFVQLFADFAFDEVI